MTTATRSAKVSHKSVQRLSIYRRILNNLRRQGVARVYSHELARSAGVSAAQVRRDLMAVTRRSKGTPAMGYGAAILARNIGRLLDGQTFEPVVLVGVGNLGRAILAYFAGRRPNIGIMATFDKDPDCTDRVISGCRCYSEAEMPRFVEERQVRLAILAVPAGAAQEVTDRLVSAGVRGILNFAPTPLRVSADVYVEDVDMTTLLEKVAFFARQRV